MVETIDAWKCGGCGRLQARDALQLPDAPDAATVAAMNARIATLWHDSIEVHFEREEALLAEWPGLLPEAHARRLVEDHVALRDDCRRAIADALDADALRAFGQRMFDHVRFEDRICFPPMQLAIHGR